MNYDNQAIRRQDRLLSEAEASQLLRDGEYGFLSMTDADGTPYGIPISYAWDGASTIYLHCAPVGRKLRCLAHCAEVSFCVVGSTRVIPDKFTTAYQSIVVRAEACTGLDAEERMQALRLLLQKYSPDDQEVGQKYAEKSFHRTEIIRLTMRSVSGKCKRM